MCSCFNCNNGSCGQALTDTDTELRARLWSVELNSLLELNTVMSCVTSCALSLQDGNGYIDEQELDALLKDLCDKNKMVVSLLIDLFGLLFRSSHIDVWSAVYVSLLPPRTWTRQAWRGTRPVSWLCLMGGSCTALSWRSSCVETPLCELLPENSPYDASTPLNPDIIRCMCDPWRLYNTSHGREKKCFWDHKMLCLALLLRLFFLFFFKYAFVFLHSAHI